MKELIEALEDLMDVQNGAPLITLEKDWQEAMEKAGKAIQKAKEWDEMDEKWESLRGQGLDKKLTSWEDQQPNKEQGGKTEQLSAEEFLKSKVREFKTSMSFEATISGHELKDLLEEYANQPIAKRDQLNAKEFLKELFKKLDEEAIMFKNYSYDIKTANQIIRQHLTEYASSDFQLQRLYDWLMNENREPAKTKFTAGTLRNVANEIDFRLKQNNRISVESFGYYFNGRFYKTEQDLRGKTMSEENQPIELFIKPQPPKQ